MTFVKKLLVAAALCGAATTAMADPKLVLFNRGDVAPTECAQALQGFEAYLQRSNTAVGSMFYANAQLGPKVGMIYGDGPDQVAVAVHAGNRNFYPELRVEASYPVFTYFLNMEIRSGGRKVNAAMGCWALGEFSARGKTAIGVAAVETDRNGTVTGSKTATEILTRWDEYLSSSGYPSGSRLRLGTALVPDDFFSPRMAPMLRFEPNIVGYNCPAKRGDVQTLFRDLYRAGNVASAIKIAHNCSPNFKSWTEQDYQLKDLPDNNDASKTIGPRYELRLR